MKKMTISLVLCLLCTSFYPLNAQTGEQIATLIETGASLIGKGIQYSKEKESTEKLARMKRNGDPYADCYFIDSNGELDIYKQDCYLPNDEVVKDILCTSCVKLQAEVETKMKAQQERQRLLQSRVWIDLGLPSGTLWCSENEGLYTIDDAKRRYKYNLPSKDQMLELQLYCDWSWNGSGYYVVGKNGNSIFLPAQGYRDKDGIIRENNVSGQYMYIDKWSDKYCTGISFKSNGLGGWFTPNHNAISVRLVQ